MTRPTLGTALFCLLLPLGAIAQDTNIEVGAMGDDVELPVELSADTLQVDHANGRADLTGNVLVVQGELRMTAGEITVRYAPETGNISELRATGGVTFVNATSAAESREALYDIEGANLVMIGDVLLTQGPTALSAERMTIDLTTGASRMEGGVRTVFQPGAN